VMWLAEVIAGFAKAILGPVVAFFAGKWWSDTRKAQDAVSEARNANKRREDVSGLDDDDLDGRLRRSLE